MSVPHPPDQAGVSQTPWLGWRVLPATHGHSQEVLQLPFYPETVTDHFHGCSSHPTLQGQGKSASKKVESPSKRLPYVRELDMDIPVANLVFLCPVTPLLQQTATLRLHALLPTNPLCVPCI